MPSAIALFPEEPFRDTVEALQAGLRERVGIEPPATPPHVSLHGAETYGAGTIDQLEELTADHGPIDLTASGIGVFTATGVVYLPVVRSQALTELHAAVSDRIGGFATDPNPYYADPNWLPHVTLAQGVGPDRRPDALDALADAPDAEVFTAASIGVIEHPADGEIRVERVPLTD